jgi:hypothetical protein
LPRRLTERGALKEFDPSIRDPIAVDPVADIKEAELAM